VLPWVSHWACDFQAKTAAITDRPHQHSNLEAETFQNKIPSVLSSTSTITPSTKGLQQGTHTNETVNTIYGKTMWNVS
jgi:hypothetical protein